MTPQIVQRLLVDEPTVPKEVRMSDRTGIKVLSRERWIAAPDVLVILDKAGILHHITYWNITAIRHLPGNGRRRRRKKRA